MGKFTDKVVIITGASSGIGEATALAFAKEGAKLTITGRNLERLSRTASRCKAEGETQVLEVIADVSKFDTLESTINKTVETFGSIDILVNNAADATPGMIEDIELEVYNTLLDTNLRPAVFLSKYALPHLKKTKGSIVNISSTAAIQTLPNRAVYSMTKCALDHFTKGFAAECVSFGVRVNSIQPAIVQTRAIENVPEEMKEAILKLAETQMLGIIAPEEIAESILFLCSSAHITGTTLMVDGGLMLNN